MTYGWEHLPKTISVHGADPSIRLREPVPGVLLELDGGWLLLDVGFNDTVVRDVEWRRRREPDFVTELPVDGPDGNVEAAFARVGIDPADVVAVAVSHFHYDHAGGLHHFAGRVPVYAQRAGARVRPPRRAIPTSQTTRTGGATSTTPRSTGAPSTATPRSSRA